METIWSFDLGKASIGEAVRDIHTNEFLHKASLLIPAEFASTKESASRRRMWRSRQAHKAREAWLDEVWRAAGLTPLVGRRVEKRDGKWQAVEESFEQRQRRELLEREQSEGCTVEWKERPLRPRWGVKFRTLPMHSNRSRLLYRTPLGGEVETGPRKLRETI